MKLSRNLTTKIHYILDNFLPPILRDSKWFVKIPFKIFYGKSAPTFFSFKDKAYRLSDKEFAQIYENVQLNIVRESDLNDACFKQILEKSVGKTVLEAGCGKGLLSAALAKKGFRVTAADIVIDQKLKEKYSQLTFKEANVEKLPFENNSFDTVVCTHTLEHVQHFPKAISELRRVATKRLIIVVPKQRPYKYTFDLHLHFFPYPHSLLTVMGNPKGICKVVDGDLFYYEDLADAQSF